MEMNINRTKRETPSWSIIITTFNRPRKIFSYLKAVLRIKYPRHNVEVIVVDDDSRFPGQSCLKAPFYDRMNLTAITQKYAGPSMAHSAGAKCAKGDFSAFTDGECMPARDWLQKLSLRFKSSPGCAIVGRSVYALEENKFDSALRSGG